MATVVKWITRTTPPLLPHLGDSVPGFMPLPYLEHNSRRFLRGEQKEYEEFVQGLRENTNVVDIRTEYRF